MLPEGLVVPLPGELVLRIPGLEARRAVPGPQTLLWLAADLLMWLAWYALPWLACLTLLPELEAQDRVLRLIDVGVVVHDVRCRKIFVLRVQ